MRKLLVLIFLLVSFFVFSDTIYINVGSNDDQLSQQMRVNIISSLLETEHTIIGNRVEADWIFEVEVINAGDIFYSYFILLDSKSNNIFYEEFISHTWVSFFPDNFTRASNYFFQYFQDILRQLQSVYN